MAHAADRSPFSLTPHASDHEKVAGDDRPPFTQSGACVQILRYVQVGDPSGHPKGDGGGGPKHSAEAKMQCENQDWAFLELLVEA